MRNFALYLAFGAGAFIVGLVIDGQTPVQAADPVSASDFTAAVSPIQFSGDRIGAPYASSNKGTNQAAACPKSSILYSPFNALRCSGQWAARFGSVWKKASFQRSPSSRTAPGSAVLPGLPNFGATASVALPQQAAFGGDDFTESNSDSGSTDIPVIRSFSASAGKVKPGSAVTLAWETNDESYLFIDNLGGVRGSSAIVKPTATTTYTLNATNEFGRSTKKVTVTVM